MFTGIIRTLGKVYERRENILAVRTPSFIADVKTGDSVSVNGVCLTVSSIKKDIFYTDVLKETMKRTNISRMKSGDIVNIEPALRAGDRIGGHIVTGHVDTVVKLIRRYKKYNDVVLEIAVPADIAGMITVKGSVALNGISLTVASVTRNRFRTHIIPYTFAGTNLKYCSPGALLNIELDKYMNAEKQ